jgi:hypothetical protein
MRNGVDQKGIDTLFKQSEVTLFWISALLTLGEVASQNYEAQPFQRQHGLLSTDDMDVRCKIVTRNHRRSWKKYRLFDVYKT